MDAIRLLQYAYIIFLLIEAEPFSGPLRLNVALGHCAKIVMEESPPFRQESGRRDKQKDLYHGLSLNVVKVSHVRFT
jgi:hypothetical protein